MLSPASPLERDNRGRGCPPLRNCGVCPRVAFFARSPFLYHRGFFGQFLFFPAVFRSWLAELFNESVPTCLRRLAVNFNQEDFDRVWEPLSQEALCNGVFTIPPFDGCVFCICVAGGVLWKRSCGRFIEVTPVVHGLHGLSEACSGGGPFGAIFFKEG